MVNNKQADNNIRIWQILQMKAAESRIMLSLLTSSHASRPHDVWSWLAEYVAAFFEADNGRFARVDPDDELELLIPSVHSKPQL